MSLGTYLTSLRAAAAGAEDAEKAYRAEAAARISALAAARAQAYRRLNVLSSLADVIAAAPDAEGAVRNARALLCARLGWDDLTPAREEVLQQFAPVARAIHANVADAPAPEGDAAHDPVAIPDAPAAMAAFELWYSSTRESTFWYLFEHNMPETPVVDF